MSQRVDKLLSRFLLPGMALLLVCISPALVGEAKEAGTPAWPSNVRVIEVRLSPETMRGVARLPLPQLRAYDSQGRRLAELVGDDSRKLSSTMATVLGGKARADASQPIAKELAKLETADGKPVGALPDADVTLVKYWAEWCMPCHTQTRELTKILQKGSSATRINLVHVDADFTKVKR